MIENIEDLENLLTDQLYLSDRHLVLACRPATEGADPFSEFFPQPVLHGQGVQSPQIISRNQRKRVIITEENHGFGRLALYDQHVAAGLL